MGNLTPRTLDDVASVARLVFPHPTNANYRFRRLLLVVKFRFWGTLGRPTAVPIGQYTRIWEDRRYASSIPAAYANPFDFAKWEVWRKIPSPSRHLRGCGVCCTFR